MISQKHINAWAFKKFGLTGSIDLKLSVDSVYYSDLTGGDSWPTIEVFCNGSLLNTIDGDQFSSILNEIIEAYEGSKNEA